MARVIVLGADGMVGHVSRIRLKEGGHEVRSVARSESPEWDRVDVEQEVNLREYIARIHPDVVINCVGVLIQESEHDPERAIRLNALLPHVLSRLAVEYGYRLIHISSDCVFSGKGGPYVEGSLRDADDTYGRAKALGELNNDRDLTIRTSKVGPELDLEGTGLFNWFMKQKGTVRGFSKVLWGGITTLELVNVLSHIIEKPITGVLHLTNGEAVSKCELLELFAEIWGRADILIEHDEGRSGDRSLKSTRADFDYKIPSYREMLLELRAFMREHSELYTHYKGF